MLIGWVQDVKILDNINHTVRDDLRVEIKRGSKVSVAAACFSMYAYQELKKQLESTEEFRFIYTSPTFVKEKAEKQKREFYIPRLSRETGLYGTEFEIKLRNEMTQRAIAKECADWIRRKAKFKSNTTGENMMGFMTVDTGTAQTAYTPMTGFTTVDIGCERGNNTSTLYCRGPVGMYRGTKEPSPKQNRNITGKVTTEDIEAEQICNEEKK